jgi:hypothetical protein
MSVLNELAASLTTHSSRTHIVMVPFITCVHHSLGFQLMLEGLPSSEKPFPPLQISEAVRMYVESLRTPIRLHISNLFTSRNTINTKTSVSEICTQAVLVFLMVKELLNETDKSICEIGPSAQGNNMYGHFFSFLIAVGSRNGDTVRHHVTCSNIVDNKATGSPTDYFGWPTLSVVFFWRFYSFSVVW